MSDAIKKPEIVRPTYHQSEIQTAQKCMRQWEFRYLMGIKIPPRGAMTLGIAVDAAVTQNLAQKISSGTDLPLESALDKYSDEFEKKSYETDWAGDNTGEIKDVGVKLVTVHHKEVAPKLEPTSVQEKFKISLNGEYDLGGTIDYTDKSGVVGDTKTAKSKYDEDFVSTSVQAQVYDFAYEALNKKPATGVRFDVLIKPTKTLSARVQQIQSVVTKAEREFLFGTIENVHKAIKAGVSTPAPEGAWWCSKDWCGYWGMCKGKKK